MGRGGKERDTSMGGTGFERVMHRRDEVGR